MLFAIQRFIRSISSEGLDQLDHIPPQSQVLLLGAGKGFDIPWLPRDIYLTVVEPDVSAHPFIQKIAHQDGREVKILSDFGENISLENASCDAVITHLVLCSVTDVTATINEITRVLRPGGMWYFAEHAYASESWIGSFQKIFHTLWYRCFSCHIDRDLETNIRKSPLTIRDLQTRFRWGRSPLVAKRLEGRAEKVL